MTQTDYSGPPPLPGQPPKSSFFHIAARASWLAPLILIGMFVLTGSAFLNASSEVRIARELFALFIILTGTLSGLVALFGIVKQGRERIMLPALIGLLINGAFLLLFRVNYMTGYRQGRAKHDQRLAAEAAASSAAAAPEAPEPPPYRISGLMLSSMYSGSSAAGMGEPATIQVEVRGTPGASTARRSLTLIVGKGDGQRMSQPPLAQETKPIGPLDAEGKAIIKFRIPIRAPQGCGPNLMWATISGQPDNAKKTGFFIYDCI